LSSVRLEVIIIVFSSIKDNVAAPGLNDPRGVRADPWGMRAGAEQMELTLYPVSVSESNPMVVLNVSHEVKRSFRLRFAFLLRGLKVFGGLSLDAQ
jgi:hypothetical protein